MLVCQQCGRIYMRHASGAARPEFFGSSDCEREWHNTHSALPEIGDEIPSGPPEAWAPGLHHPAERAAADGTPEAAPAPAEVPETPWAAAQRRRDACRARIREALDSMAPKPLERYFTPDARYRVTCKLGSWEFPNFDDALRNAQALWCGPGEPATIDAVADGTRAVLMRIPEDLPAV